MIPLKLSVNNFLSYRGEVPPLDLSGIHVACLCGPNGHGKSALLDAITWALWGSARGRSQDDLVHFGQQDMEVDLEFLARDTRYRVVRRHSRGGPKSRSGKSSLELQVSGGNGFHPITGNTIRETQAKVQQIIGMDYDTFINSAFLIQGRADEFTNKSPGERKEVLGRILGLGRYDDLQERSRHQAGDKQRQADDIETAFQFMDTEIARKENHLQILDAVKGELQALDLSLSAKGREVDALRLQVQTLEQRASEVRELETRLPQMESDITHYREEVQSLCPRIQAYQALVDAKPSIEEEFRRFLELGQNLQEMEQTRENHDTLIRQRTELQQIIAPARVRLEERIAVSHRRLEEELQPKAGKVDGLEAEKARVVQTRERLEAEEEELQAQRLEMQEVAARVGEASASQVRLQTEGEELRAKLDLLKGSHGESMCPLCQTSLGQEGCDRLSESYQAQITQMRDQFRQRQAALQDLQAREKALGQDISKREVGLRQRREGLQRQLTTLERDLEDSLRAAQETADVARDLVEQRRLLDKGLYASQEQTALTELENRMAALGYSPEDQRRLSTELQKLQPSQLRHQQLAEALENLPREEASLTRAQEMESRRQNEVAQARERLAQVRVETQDLGQRKEMLESAQRDLLSLQARQQELTHRRGDMEGNLQRIEELERRKGSKSSELTALREEQSIYQDLTQAFGRQGVQALLIETILPQIEDEANDLLGRMTDGRMAVKLETQRELRSRRGEFAETLEIRISDELGPRSYEMFSGGEAFRINLALRIALSKVLARRSGAPLPTLFIDEGFGTQDTAGRERILDVIRAIEPDFERIIVITHLEDLKEAFPVRIEVSKTNGASTFWLS